MVINIYGRDLDTLDRDAQAIAGVLASVPGATDVLLQSPPGTPQLVVRLKHDKLQQWGLHAADVLDNIRAAYEGVPVTQVYQDNSVIGVSVMLQPEAHGVRHVGKLPLINNEGQIVRLNDRSEKNTSELQSLMRISYA